MQQNELLKWAKDALSMESEAILNLTHLLTLDFPEVIALILQSRGRVIITGIGKSAIIGQKIVATLNSTGTPSLFMHAAEAIHGDLGMVMADDVLICISKSGNSPEIKTLIPLLKRGRNKIVGIVGDINSFLAKNVDYILDTTVEKEACPNNLAPTTSTTAQLAMGDAIAVCLLKSKKFSSNDFAMFHPGGALGKRVYLTLKNLASDNFNPIVNTKDTLQDCIFAITKGRMGAVVVCDENKKPIGIITDGDLRRKLLSKDWNLQLTASDIMTKNPVLLEDITLAYEGAEILKKKRINHLILTSEGEFSGIVHIQDFIKEGIL